MTTKDNLIRDAALPETSARLTREPSGDHFHLLPAHDRPRERLLRSGAAAATDADLLAILLRTGRPGTSVLELAREVLADAGGLEGLLNASKESLRHKGLGPAKAAILLATFEIARRLSRRQFDERAVLEHPDAVANYLMMRYSREDQEVVGALYLNVRNRLIAEVELYRGALDHAFVEPRQILREALRHRASAFVLFHTHPSGDPTPSVEDVRFTHRLGEAAELMGIKLIDHLVVARAGRWVSILRKELKEDLDRKIRDWSQPPHSPA